jgi:hypothetical protein
MDVILYAATAALFAVSAWSVVVFVSIINMMRSVRQIRGSFRKVDLLEAAVLVAIIGGAWYTWANQSTLHENQMCALMLPFVTASIFTLLYISERHVKNIRNIRTIKRSLTSNKK